MIPMHPNQIGGGRVQRTFTFGSRRMLAGETLTGDELRSIRTQNRNAMVEKGFILLWPKDAGESFGQSPSCSVRFVRPLGFGRYDVIEGRKLNEDYLDKEAAYALAGIEMPAEKATN